MGSDKDLIDLWCDELERSRNQGRQAFFEILAHACSSIAKLDGGNTLWGVYRNIRDVESWRQDEESVDHRDDLYSRLFADELPDEPCAGQVVK